MQEVTSGESGHGWYGSLFVVEWVEVKNELRHEKKNNQHVNRSVYVLTDDGHAPDAIILSAQGFYAR